MTVALVCFREGLAEVTFWADRAEAAEADRELSPCDDDGCEMCHCIVERLGAERFRVTTTSKEEP